MASLARVYRLAKLFAALGNIPFFPFENCDDEQPCQGTDRQCQPKPWICGVACLRHWLMSFIWAGRLIAIRRCARCAATTGQVVIECRYRGSPSANRTSCNCAVAAVYALALDKLINTSGDSTLCFRPLSPITEAGLCIVWKKYQVFSRAASLFLSQLKKEFGIEKMNLSE